MVERKVSRTVTGTQTEDGAGVKLTRVIGHRDVKDFDPFLMLDAFDSRNPGDYAAGFPWHPHRGIETVTYLIAGNIEHKDSLGNTGNIRDGSCQWMTAGCGILHQEMPLPSPRMFGTQLWINLPREHKMTAPAYNDISPEAIVKVRENGAVVHVISGHYKELQAPMQGHFVKAVYLDVELEPEKEWSLASPSDHTVFLYILQGSLRIGGNTYAAKRAVLFTPGDSVSVTAGKDAARFLYFSAKPLHEPVAWSGSIVMNTREELKQAFSELDKGTFIQEGRKISEIHL